MIMIMRVKKIIASNQHFVFLILTWTQQFHETVSVSNPQWIQDNMFCYDPNEPCGPEFWTGTCQTGQRQSPIDIRIHKVSIVKRWTYFRFNTPYISSQPSFFARNTGHSFQVQFEDGLNPRSSLSFGGGALTDDEYRFGQLHFHWGSEHTFNGIRYPLELHIVHYNFKYPSLMDAINAEFDPVALAVFAIFFQVGEPNPAMESIVNVARMSMAFGQNYQSYQNPINVQDLLPGKLTFFRYFGSLTTPPCTENVVWTVFTHPVSISLQQVKVFQEMRDEHDLFFTNFRPTQPHNGRIIQMIGVPGLRRALISQKSDLFQKLPLFSQGLMEVMSGFFQFLRMQVVNNFTFMRMWLETFLNGVFSSSSSLFPNAFKNMQLVVL